MKRLSGSLYRFGRSFCRDPHDAEDVMQDVLAALLSSLEKFRGDSSLSTWAWVVARNACARRRRHAGRAAALDSDEGARALELEDPAGGPDRALERRQLGEALERAIAALPAAQRDVLVLRDVEGLPAARVAKLLRLNVRAVKSRLHRARVALRESLAAHGREIPPAGADCPDTARLLSRHLEGELSESLCADLESHVSRCPHCGAVCDSMRAALGACRRWKSSAPPAPLRRALAGALRAGLRHDAGSTDRAGARAPRERRSA